MRHRFIHISELNADTVGFQSFSQSSSDNSEDIERMKKILALALANELTERQRICIEAYYFGGKKMNEIAEELGVAPSTVTRHIQSGKTKLRNIAQYYI